MRASIIAGWRKPRLVNYLLYPLSLVYRVLVWLRQIGYSCGLFKSSRLSVPVIVVGNITVGGSGKTPLVITIATHLRKSGYRPGVVSRGYGGSSAFWPREVEDSTTAEIVGDEPQMIYERTGVAVVVGPDRVRSGLTLIDKLHCNVLVSDDGFQHFALRRDLDIVVVDGDYGFGNGWCLPAGPLREPASAIDRARIIITNGETTDTVVKSASPFRMEMVLTDAFNLADNNRTHLARFSGMTVHAVAGIGNPERFFNQLEAFDIDLIRHDFPDHHRFTPQELAFGDGYPILMTEKDGIKCREFAQENIWVVCADLDIDHQVLEEIDTVLDSADSVRGQ